MFAIGGAHAVFTNRTGGCSVAPFDTLNLGLHVGDDPARVRQNRRIVDEAIGHDVVWMKQVHSARVGVVRAGYTHITEVADALICDTEEFRRVGLGIPALGVMVADCVPVLLASADGRFLAAIHAGRAGVVTGIIGQTLWRLRELGAEITSLHAAIGPSICGSCYEVDADMRSHVASVVAQTWSTTRQGSPALDLRAGVKAQLSDRGVKVSFVSKRCTVEDPNLYSYRRHHQTGRFAGIVMP